VDIRKYCAAREGALMPSAVSDKRCPRRITGSTAINCVAALLGAFLTSVTTREPKTFGSIQKNSFWKWMPVIW